MHLCLVKTQARATFMLPTLLNSHLLHSLAPKIVVIVIIIVYIVISTSLNKRGRRFSFIVVLLQALQFELRSIVSFKAFLQQQKQKQICRSKYKTLRLKFFNQVARIHQFQRI